MTVNELTYINDRLREIADALEEGREVPTSDLLELVCRVDDAERRSRMTGIDDDPEAVWVRLDEQVRRSRELRARIEASRAAPPALTLLRSESGSESGSDGGSGRDGADDA